MFKQLLVSCGLVLFCLDAQAELKTVPFVDVARYAGTWYQIARNPLIFENGCVCSRQILSPNSPGVVNVYNSCNNETPTGPLGEIRGTATSDDSITNAKFTVDFGLPNKGQYWIIALDSDYRYAVVSEPSLRSLYILSKTPVLAPELFDQAVQEARAQIDTSRLEMTLQEGCTYPSADIRVALQAPNDPEHPGSKLYSYGFERRNLTCGGRAVNVFLPTPREANENFPAVVYGHGQALGLEHYSATFEHLAKKGVAVVFPMYDKGFFDQDWTRMGNDFINLTDCAIQSVDSQIDKNHIVFSGHSKGAYVASIATGLASREGSPVKPDAAVLFETAGFDSSTAQQIDASVALTVVFGERDTVVKRDLSESLYSTAKSHRKQFILVKSYPGGPQADHYWPQTKGALFGGGNEGALHYYGAWKWLAAAAFDAKEGNKTVNRYLYGDLATNKGTVGLEDEVKRNW